METTQTDWDDLNRNIINNCEKRISEYKSLLEQVGRNRDTWDPQDEFTQWFRGHIREQKNQEETYLAKVRDEQRWTRQGLNPPYAYPEKIRTL